MNLFLYNVMLASIWAALTGVVTASNLTLGFVIGYVVLAILHRGATGPEPYFRKSAQFVGFMIYFFVELVHSSLRVLHDIVTPKLHMKPGVIAIPLDAETDLEITLLANIISLTPGTLSLDVSPDRKTLYIHAMFVDDPDALRAEIKDGLEHRLLTLLRSDHD